ncbi:MAG: DUF2568 domain-containing protein [Nitriliruptoraceae bacterium]
MSAPSMAGWNQALRFVLELSALVGLCALGWTIADAAVRWVFAILLPVAAAVVWATVRVDGDPGPAPVAVAGWMRLVIEFVVLGSGTAGLALIDPRAGVIAAAALVVHYATTGARVRWMLSG